MSTTGIPAQLGRRRITSRAELEHVAFELFDRQGFEGTTIDDIAVAAGIGRRTFFRYFPSKNDVPWGNFEDELDRMRAWLAACPPQWPLMDAIRLAIVDFNQVPPGDERWHRRRMQLILGVPVLQAHSTLRYAEWRQVIADFVAERTGEPACALLPQTIAYAMLGVAIAAYEQWLQDDDGNLSELLDTAMRDLAAAFGDGLPLRARPRAVMSGPGARDDTGAVVPVPARVSRVVSLVPSLTETVAVTAPGLVAGATDWCTHPAGLDVPRVRGTKNPDLAAVIALRPDVVLANEEENRPADLAALRDAGLPVWVTVIRTLDEALVSLRRLLTVACQLPAPRWLDAAERVWAAFPPDVRRGQARRRGARR